MRIEMPGASSITASGSVVDGPVARMRTVLDTVRTVAHKRPESDGPDLAAIGTARELETPYR